MAETKGKAGRKDKYFSHVQPKLELIKAWCRDGLFEKDICLKLGIGVSNFNVYKNEHEELRNALREGKELIDVKVENALLKNALGYEYDEVKTIVENVNGKKHVRKEITRKIVAGDTRAQLFWLKNRKPREWKNDYKVNMEHSGSVIVFEGENELED